jgi:EmrB/QacA subfamily drug resistance transporter
MLKYLVFATAALSLLMASIDSSVIAVAFPQMINDLGTNVLWAAWTISIHFIALTMAMPVGGSLSDSLGRKKLFLISLALFTGSSLGCGLSSNIYLLIFFRFLQGIGGASFLPTASGIVSDYFPKNRAVVIGLFSSIFNIGSIIGPNLGGWIVSKFSWRYVFYINLPIGILIAILTMVLLKPSPVSSRQKTDYAGALLMAGSILFFMLGLNLIAEGHSFPFILLPASCLIVSFFMARFLLVHERKESKPILDLTLLKSRPFLAANLLNLITGAGALGILSFIPLYATSVHKLSTLASGMIMTPRSLGVICTSIATSFMLIRLGYRRPMVVGISLMAISTAFLGGGPLLWASIATQWSVVLVISVCLFVGGIGAGIAFPAVNNACIELMPDKVASIVGLRGMFRMVGAALGVSLITFALHMSKDPGTGFTITFLASGIALALAIPLIFLMPSGKKG